MKLRILAFSVRQYTTKSGNLFPFSTRSLSDPTLLISNFSKLFQRESPITLSLVPEARRTFHRLLPVIITHFVVLQTFRARHHRFVSRNRYRFGKLSETDVPLTKGFGRTLDYAELLHGSAMKGRPRKVGEAHLLCVEDET